ncbi:hypothetical protein C8K44_12434 [Aminobacter sp. AP02]|nr:hypothetical protein C8K44_12434 [Aminobacter sp. AP02]
MRSMAFKAALAALLITAPMASAFAKEHTSDTSGSPSHETYRDFFDGGDNTGNSTSIAGHLQVHPVSYILSELRNDDARIANDRHMRRISAAQARQLTGEDAAIRRTATSDAGYGGMLSAGTYSQLQSEVSSLGSQISRDAGR